MNNINFMAIDPSKRSTGIFIKTNNLTDLYTIKFNQKVPDNDLFKSLSKKIIKHVSFYKIDLIFIENNPFSGFSYKSRSPSKMSEIIGIIKLAAFTANSNIKIIELSNQLWKGILKGYPFLNKNKNKKYIEQANIYLKQTFSTSDEVDAYCIGLAMNYIYKGIAWTDAQMRMKNKIISICNEIEANKLF